MNPLHEVTQRVFADGDTQTLDIHHSTVVACWLPTGNGIMVTLDRYAHESWIGTARIAFGAVTRGARFPDGTIRLEDVMFEATVDNTEFLTRLLEWLKTQ